MANVEACAGKELKTVQGKLLKRQRTELIVAWKKAKPQSRQDWLRSGSSGKEIFLVDHQLLKRSFRWKM